MGRGTSFLFRSRQRAQEPTPARARRISGGPQSRPGAIPGDRESLEDAASPNNCSSSWLRRLIADRRGMMLVELAIAVPFVAALALGAAEVGRYLLLNQKLESATAQLADIFTREETLSVAQHDRTSFLFRAARRIAAVGIPGDDRGTRPAGRVLQPRPRCRDHRGSTVGIDPGCRIENEGGDLR